MTTGFEPFSNSKLTFKISDTTSSVDTETGNVVMDTISKVYDAFLAQKRPPDYLADDGIDTTAIYLEGRLVSPWRFDSGVYPNRVATATFNGISGEFELLPEEELIAASYKPWAGTKIRGWFKAFGPARSTP